MGEYPIIDELGTSPLTYEPPSTCQINKGDIWLQFENFEKICQVALSYRKIKNKP
jgi:hypothetical protein